MPDGNSLPYLGDITITQKLPSDGSTVVVTITWTVKAIRPSVIEVYTMFGPSAGNLLDLGYLRDTVATTTSPITVPVPGANRNPLLYIGLAPRNLESDGITKTDEMVDASGEPQPWENFVTQRGLNVTYAPGPPSSKFPPPNVQAQSFVKTLNNNDYILVSVSAANSDGYNLIVNSGGTDEAQQHSDDGSFPPVPTIPGRAYSFRAEEHNTGSGQNAPGWSLFSTPITVIANPRVRSLRTFLSISGVLNQGAGVRRYTLNTVGSTRIMMGL
jgi:hypothetical protein